MQYAYANLRVITKQFIHAHSNACSHTFRTFVNQFAHLQTCRLTHPHSLQQSNPHICTITLSRYKSTCLTDFYLHDATPNMVLWP